MIVKRCLPAVTVRSAAARSEAWSAAASRFSRGDAGLDRLRHGRHTRHLGVRRSQDRVDSQQGRGHVHRPSVDGRIGPEERAPFRQADTGVDRVAGHLCGDDHQAAAGKFSVVLGDRQHAGATDKTPDAIQRLLRHGALATDLERRVEHGGEVVVAGDGGVGDGDRLSIHGQRDPAVAEGRQGCA